MAMPTTRSVEGFSKHPVVLPLKARQRGIATVLIVILVGMSLSAAVLGMMHYLRGAQSQLLSVHTQTQAQMRAWSGAEAVRLYLLKMQEDGQLAALAGNIGSGLPIGISGLDGVSAKFVGVDDPANPSEFRVEVTGVAAEANQAMSKSTLLVVFAGKSTSAGIADSPQNPNVITFKRNLRLGGEISVEANPDFGPVTINIDGDLSTGGNIISGVSILNSTGSISIGSGSTFDQLNANCDVQLTGSVTSKIVNARRNACFTGGAGVTEATTANGSVSAQASYDVNGAISAIGNATDVGSCRPSGSSEDTANSLAATCPLPKAQYVVDLEFGSAGAKSVKAKGSVILGSGRIGHLEADGGLTVNWGAHVDGGLVGAPVIYPSEWFPKSDVKVIQQQGLNVLIPAVSRVTMDSQVIDAYDYESAANYVFKVDSMGYKKVTVRSVNGIADGEYYLGWFLDTNNGKVDYLCASLDPTSTSIDSPHCNEALSGSARTICEGYSAQNTCFSYDKENRKWNINGKSIAPGIAWFEGSLNVGSGIYYNTFVVTENVTTSGDDTIYAPNFAGFDGFVDGKQYAPNGICKHASYPGLYPTQFCDMSAGTYDYNALRGIGNYVFIAGSIKNGKYIDENSYVGGNVSTGAKTELFGSIIAGNEFTSAGETTIHGYMTALASGKTVNNSMGAKTTIKLTNLPEGYSPTGGKFTNPDGNPSTPEAGGPISMKWVRYL